MFHKIYFKKAVSSAKSKNNTFFFWAFLAIEFCLKPIEEHVQKHLQNLTPQSAIL